MQNLSFRYTQWINWRTKRRGHLFQGRYKTVLVEEDEYLLQLVAYLHLNPVRAAMVENPTDYRWSSHRAYLGTEQTPWLASDPLLERFSSKVKSARNLFANYVFNQKGTGHRKEFHGRGCKDSRIFGEDSFIAEVLQRTEELSSQPPDLETTLSVIANSFDCKVESLLMPGQGRNISQIRAFAAWAVREYSTATLMDLSRWLVKDVSTLSSAARRLCEKAKTDADIKKKMKELHGQLAQFTTLQA